MIVHAPTVIALGPLMLSGYGLALAASMLLGFLVVAREYRRLAVPAQALEDIIVVLVVAVAGAKVYDMLTGNASLWSRSGFSMVGGALASVPTMWWLTRTRAVPRSHIADAMALGAAAAIPVARSGCWAIGDDYGRPFNGSWAVAFPNGAPPSTVETFRTQFGETLPGLDASTVLAVHPTQLYELVLAFGIFVWLWQRRHTAAPWSTAGAFLLLSALERFAMEFVRAKADRTLPGGFTVTQAVTVGLIAAGGVVWSRAQRARLVSGA
jgi:phosphatidylglycerol---prolipoprotein diacylglyceryl transferase